ncbi:MAG TPA: DNA-3-methyladenine glycosylase [Acidimicrobiia bacterium]|nr:DNA-3-methyladenine glycosylase [Acidimicrobiia bacterium]
MTSLAALLEEPVLDAAPRLLGATVTTRFDGALVVVRLNEVEAYVGADDPASHAFRGRTRRNGSMFGAAGTLYVYRSYGLHWCMNVVTGAPNVPHAILLRGGIVVEGRATAVQRRGRSEHLADGPGKLTQALGVLGEHDGTSVLTGPVRVELPDHPPPESRIVSTPRIGISKAVEEPWRFVLEHRD